MHAISEPRTADAVLVRPVLQRVHHAKHQPAALQRAALTAVPIPPAVVLQQRVKQVAAHLPVAAMQAAARQHHPAVWLQQAALRVTVIVLPHLRAQRAAR